MLILVGKIAVNIVVFMTIYILVLIAVHVVVGSQLKEIREAIGRIEDRLDRIEVVTNQFILMHPASTLEPIRVMRSVDQPTGEEDTE